MSLSLQMWWRTLARAVLHLRKVSGLLTSYTIAITELPFHCHDTTYVSAANINVQVHFIVTIELEREAIYNEHVSD